ncbi:MAG: FtsX-like permease family protein [Anaerococcus vaginalis]|uniref:ABC transporter permease n=1 Tax=Anaerococcus vaginalis TaxID=33037 RepID=UPI002912FD6B|nr:FtsX-like permease family protein [Anaerococcus vaginalis]MDU6181166.1 FtsX-like permease family protein [Anaerococcus vaginalis]MDU7431995.1 FtsX-like permease family protein [Anaerococcus vaginalis]
MKSYLSLIPISAKVRKKQNHLTLMCIAISVFLVTSIFSMAEIVLRMEMDRLKLKHTGFSFNDVLKSNLGQTLIPIAIILFILILVAGALMISGSINNSIAQRTKFFGMMRSLGMSTGQIKKFVRLESLNWCKTSIPFGTLIGVVSTWILCGGLRYIVGEEFSNVPVFTISIFGILAGILVGLASVLIAAKKPAKEASKISPIVALSGNEKSNIGNKQLVNNKFFNIEKLLGINHAIENKKNLFLMSASFALSIILFLTFIVFGQFVNYIMPQSSARADIAIMSKDTSNNINPNLLDKLEKVEGVKNVYGRRSAFDVNAILESESNLREKIDIISYDDFDLKSLKRDKALKRKSDLSKVFGNSHYVLATWDRDSDKKIGDKIKINGEDFEIAGLLKYDPFTSDGETGGKTTIITSSETFKQIINEVEYNLVMLQTDENFSDESINEIQKLIENKNIIRDRRDQKTTGTYMAFMFFVYGFIAIIGLVSLLNSINSISISVSSKIKQYGMMRAVGMDKFQIKRMIKVESATYGFFGSFIGIIVGVLLNKIIFTKLIENHFSYAVWQFPILPVIISIGFILISVIISTYKPIKRINKMSITDNINEL